MKASYAPRRFHCTRMCAVALKRSAGAAAASPSVAQARAQQISAVTAGLPRGVGAGSRVVRPYLHTKSQKSPTEVGFLESAMTAGEERAAPTCVPKKSSPERCRRSSSTWPATAPLRRGFSLREFTILTCEQTSASHKMDRTKREGDVARRARSCHLFCARNRVSHGFSCRRAELP